jgi:hypothetical protein
MNTQKFETFSEFYSFYLSQHKNPTCRSLHLLGFFFGSLTFAIVLVTANWVYLPATLLFAYGFAWVGHFFFEKNTPATFTYPLFSFRGDLTLVRDMLTGKL